MKKVLLLTLLTFLFFTVDAHGFFFYKEVNLVMGYSDQVGYLNRSAGQRTGLGFEYFDKFSNDYGDFLTLNLQVRLVTQPSNTNSDDYLVEVHNAFAELKFGLGYKFRIGHFVPSFGLETYIDTHSSLIQTINSLNIGYKKDWGIGIKGYFKETDYEFSIQTGSGMSIKIHDSSYLISARVSHTTISELQVGISLLNGQILRFTQMSTYPTPELALNKSIKISRIGLDLQFNILAFSFKNEFVYGKTDDNPEWGLFLQGSYPFELMNSMSLDSYLKNWGEKNTENETLEISELGIGITKQIDSTLKMEVLYTYDLKNDFGVRDKQFIFQIYYYLK